ncbi:MAG TPA: YafY family protein [Gammaproteobacteria bacterium]|nr:YafY family transcriptional regulator [Xanthomonadales bacterium]HOP23324.1 YafY family protein [Gammaproteobacteria bacterium]HPI97095.1 YafY family protein [Gammaproteobacteria bacterium]
MRRADRLMKITHFLRKRRQVVTAQQIAETFEVCKRTVYRDIEVLINTGVPIRGEAGVGYTIDKKYFLPPITFDADELEAISLGISMVRQWTDEHFATKAKSAFEKIEAVLPANLQGELEQITTFAIPNRPNVPWKINFSELREYIRIQRKVNVKYIDANHEKTARVIRPLALFFFNPVWLLAGWCELRKDFRNFRLDRIQSLSVLEEFFKNDPEKNLQAYMLKVSCDEL